jgi:hypothetical protein
MWLWCSRYWKDRRGDGVRINQPPMGRTNLNQQLVSRLCQRRALHMILAVATISFLLVVHLAQEGYEEGSGLLGLHIRRASLNDDDDDDNRTRIVVGESGTVVRETILRRSDFPSRPESPYEERWPGFRIPKYFEKPFFLRQHEYPVTGCFVHVGKTAGSSLGCALGFRLHCQKELRHPRGYLPRLTTNLIHSDVNDCHLRHDYYLFSMRNPLERIQSWYVYEEKKLQPLIANCSFATLNDLAERGLETLVGYKERIRSLMINGTNSTAAMGNATSNLTTLIRQPGSTRCRYKSRRVIRGTEKLGSHAYYNYAKYVTQIPDDAIVGVIRTPHLVEDYNAMEAYVTRRVHEKQLQQKHNASRKSWNPLASIAARQQLPPPPVQIARLGSKNRTPVRLNSTNATTGSVEDGPAPAVFRAADPRRYLSDRARTLLCAALCDEIQVYKRILRRAVNLRESDVQESLAELRETCPLEADLPGACPY